MSTPETNSTPTGAPTDATRRVPDVGWREGEETVLLVEDHDVIRELLATGLRSRGFRVLAAANADEALDLAEHEPGVIDLLLTDIVMPGMNGRELAEKLSVTRPEMRILLTSAYAGEAKVPRGSTNAREAFIAKPYLADDLALKIREVLQTDPTS